ncbi:MAG: adenylate/guanylate cyclase domain-containing protein [Smithellaceae bacterium]|nr:adenylate/guanylate cyclase domain-containing protein [Smithellaceae bacterium]
MNGLIIVDDEEGVRRSLKKVLERDGYSIFLADNGEEAVGIVRRNRNGIDTVISDYKMPGMDGLETLTEIGKINPEITRIMLTGYATMESAIDAVNEGIDGFLTKPFENKELRAKIKEYILRKRLKQFVSEQVFDLLQDTDHSMIPQRRKVSIVFIDVRGFTSLSEKIDPGELSDLLNSSFFTPLDDIIFRYNGTLDKHIGDSIMGVFGAPLSYEDDSLRAVRSALEMKEKMEEVNRVLVSQGISIPVGIGISTGEAMAGIFGSTRKKEYTVYGAVVNLAARLENLAGEGQILICEETYRGVSDFVSVEEVTPASIRGMERKVGVFRVISALPVPER